MARNILAAIRRARQIIPAHLRMTLQEIGHRMNDSGHGRMAHAILEYATGRCRRTIQYHLDALVNLHILRRIRQRLGLRNLPNLYILCLPIVPMASSFSGATPASTLPPPAHRQEKSLSIAAEIQELEKGMRLWTEGGEQWQANQEALTRLRGLLRDTDA
jgi:hypothetical protein